MAGLPKMKGANYRRLELFQRLCFSDLPLSELGLLSATSSDCQGFARCETHLPTNLRTAGFFPSSSRTRCESAGPLLARG